MLGSSLTDSVLITQAVDLHSRVSIGREVMGFTTAEKSSISVRKKFLAITIAKCSSKYDEGFLTERLSITQEEGTYSAGVTSSLMCCDILRKNDTTWDNVHSTNSSS